MTMLKKNEASLTGEAPISEILCGFHGYCNSIGNSFLTDSVTTRIARPNACLISPNKLSKIDVLYNLRYELKNLGCRFNPVNKGWIFPIYKKASVETLLQDLEVSYKDIYDEYYDKSREEQLADDEWTRIDRLEQQSYQEDRAIMMAKYNLEEKINRNSLDQAIPEIAAEIEEIEKKEINQAKIKKEIDQRRAVVGILAEVATKNLEDLNCFPHGFSFKNGCLIFQEESKQSEEEYQHPIVICFQELRVEGRVRNEHSKNWGLLISFRDAAGIHKRYTLPMRLLSGEDRELRGILLDLGLCIAPLKKARQLLTNYLSLSRPKKLMRSVSATGWYKNSFVLASDLIFGSFGDEELIFQSDSSCQSKYSVSGTLEQWRQEVAGLCGGNSRLLFALGVSFLGPLLHLLGLESGGFHFVGLSSKGKSSALKLACSVWGSDKYLESWKATSNGLEGIASSHTDTFLALDEISEVDPFEIGNILYSLGNGLGKARANQCGGSKERSSWRISFLSSGEEQISTLIEKFGGRIKAGQVVRLLEIPLNSEHGIFDSLNGFSNGRLFSEELVARCSRVYGIAGRTFIERLVQESEKVKLTARSQLREFVSEHLPKGSDSVVGRALKRFGAVAIAGELAIDFGILPYKKGECTDAVLTCFNEWIKLRGGVTSFEEKQIISRVRCFFAEHGDSYFPLLKSYDPNENKTIDILGFKKTINKEVHYLLTREVFENEICKGDNVSDVVDKCIRNGLLKRNAQGEPTHPIRIPGAKIPERMYVFNSDIYEER